MVDMDFRAAIVITITAITAAIGVDGITANAKQRT